MIDILMPNDWAWRGTILVLALGLDAWLGEPEWLWRRCPHPVVVFGRSIAMAEAWGSNRRLFKGRVRRVIGAVAILGLVSIASIIGMAIAALASFGGVALTLGVEITLVAILLAGRSLDTHVRAVATALSAQNLPLARHNIALLVSRKTDSLDASTIAKASIETTAENFSDGVIAPALFYLAFGLGGICAYKMINTADSMVGYKSSRYLAWGWGAARLDDAANFIPARLAAVVLACAKPKKMCHALSIAWRDAGYHRSPNAGWVEAVMAALLGVTLAEPRHYGTRLSQNPPLYAEGRKEATHQDITHALRLMWRGIVVFAVMVGGVAIITRLF